MRPLVELGQDDDHGPFVLAAVRQPCVTANSRGRFVEDRLLAAQPGGALGRSPRLRAATGGAEPRVLRRIEQEQDRPRLGQVPGDRAGRGVLPGLEMLARVVIQAEHPRRRCSLAAGMVLPRLHREQERTWVADRLLAIGDRVVQLALKLGLADQAAQRNDGGLVGVEEQRLLALVQDPVRGRVGVGESQTLKWSGKTCRNCQVIAVRKYDLPLAGAPRIETNSGSISSMARGIGR